MKDTRTKEVERAAKLIEEAATLHTPSGVIKPSKAASRDLLNALYDIYDYQRKQPLLKRIYNYLINKETLL